MAKPRSHSLFKRQETDFDATVPSDEGARQTLRIHHIQ